MADHSSTPTHKHAFNSESFQAANQTEVRQARVDRRHVHGEESVAFSGSISVAVTQ